MVDNFAGQLDFVGIHVELDFLTKPEEQGGGILEHQSKSAVVQKTDNTRKVGRPAEAWTERLQVLNSRH